MKRILYILALIGSGLWAQNLQSGLEAHYTFDGHTLDASVNGHDLQNGLGSVTYTTVSGTDQAVYFDGNDRLDQIGSFDNSTWTESAMATWIKTSNISSQDQFILQGAYMGFGLYLESNNGFVGGVFDGSSSNALYNTYSIADGEWHHVVYQTNGVTTSLYIDGVYVSSMLEPLFTGNGGSNNKIYMGQAIIAPRPYTGYVNDCRIYNRTLSLCEIQMLAGVDANTADLLTETACSDYLWTQTNMVYTQSGLYSDTLINSSGCDSIITLDLTILDFVYADTLTETACSDYLWTQTNMVYTQSGLYSDTLINNGGCDSIITLDLTILDFVYGDTLTETACSDYLWSQSNMVYTESGLYSDTLINSGGCDSIITLDLTILDFVYGDTLIETACSDYLWTQTNMVYTQSGLYSDTLINSSGCDSIVVLDLTVTTLDTTVTVGNGMFSSNATGVTYNWIDCEDESLVGTGQTFSPIYAGSYAVIVSDGVCVDTSDCYVFNKLNVEEAYNVPVLKVLTELGSGHVRLEVDKLYPDAILLVRNIEGKLMNRIDVKEHFIELDINQVGLYVLEFRTMNTVVTKKIVIH